MILTNCAACAAHWPTTRHAAQRVRRRVHKLVNILPTGANRQDARKERISSLLPEASFFGEMAAQQPARAGFARQLSWGMRTCGSVYYNNKRDVKRGTSA